MRTQDNSVAFRTEAEHHAEIENALYAISPDLPREDWVQVGMAIKSELGDSGFPLWDSWSQGAPDSYKEKDARDTWKSFKGGGVGIGTMFKMAQNRGWKPLQRPKATRTAAVKPKPQAIDKNPVAVDSVVLDKVKAAWDSAKPADSHPYLEARRVKSYGLRVDSTGALLVPIHYAGQMVSIQRIPADLTQKKKNIADAPNKGGSFMIGDPESSTRIYVAEGYATAASVHEATGEPVVVTFGVDNLLLVGMRLRGTYPEKEIVFAADDDADKAVNVGVEKATKAAEEVDGLVAIPEFGKSRPEGVSDFNDMARLLGRDAVLAALNAAESPDAGLLDVYEYDVDTMTPVEFVLDGFISTGITLIAGSPGVGKTTAIVTAAAYAAGLCDKNPDFVPTLRRKVYYVTEDPAQVGRICYGLCKHGVSNVKAAEWRDWFVVVNAKRKKPEELARTIKHIRRRGAHRCGEELGSYVTEPLVVLDTSNATLDMDDENNNAEAGKAIACVKEVIGKAALWLMGHTAKSMKRADVKLLSFRGAGAFEGDCHAVSYLFQENDADRDVRFWALGKHRYESEFKEVQILSMADYVEVKTAWGKIQRCWYRIGNLLKSSESERIEQREKRKEEDRTKADEGRALETRGKITAALLEAAKENEVMSKSKLKKIVGGKDSFIDDQIEVMRDAGLLKVEVGLRNTHILTLT